MRIVHIISGDLWAGAEVMYHRLMKGLMLFQDVELMAILLNEGKLADELRDLGIPVYVLDESKRSFLRMVQDSRKIIEQASPDIVHSHRLKENLIAYYSASSRKREIFLISTQHGMPEPISLRRKRIKSNILLRYNYHIVSKYFSRLVAVSHDMENSLAERYKFPKNKISVVHNGTEIPERELTEKNGESFVIGSAGRLHPVKDYPFMVEVASEILRRTNNVRFELAGEGPEEDNILNVVRHFNIQNSFTLKGFIGTMGTFYEGLDIYINTSQHEGFPMSVLEAMASGLPVVAMNRGGMKEILEDGVNGYLVNERNSIGFAEKCLRIMTDRKLRLHMGRTARESVKKKFSSTIMAERYHNLYLRVMGKQNDVRSDQWI